MAFATAGARRTAKTCGHGATHVWDGCHGTVATLWHTRRHCRKNFSAIVATDITVGLVVDQLGLAGCLPGSVANYRKQESSVSQAIDFLRSDFRIWPRKDNFATEPPSPTSPVWAAPGRGARAR